MCNCGATGYAFEEAADLLQHLDTKLAELNPYAIPCLNEFGVTDLEEVRCGLVGRQGSIEHCKGARRSDGAGCRSNAPMEPRASGLGMCRNAGKTYRLSDAIRRLSPPRAPGHRDLATRR